MGWDPIAPALNCQEYSDLLEQHEAELKTQRLAIIEECAQVCENMANPHADTVECAAAIRALKDKPHD